MVMFTIALSFIIYQTVSTWEFMFAVPDVAVNIKWTVWTIVLPDADGGSVMVTVFLT